MLECPLQRSQPGNVDVVAIMALEKLQNWQTWLINMFDNLREVLQLERVEVKLIKFAQHR